MVSGAKTEEKRKDLMLEIERLKKNKVLWRARKSLQRKS